MATIRKIQRAKGIVFKAIIKKRGIALTSKTFRLKGEAKTWAASIENDSQRMDALLRLSKESGTVPSNFQTLADQFLTQWLGKDITLPGRVEWWCDRIGDLPLSSITTHDLQRHLKKYAKTETRVGRLPTPATVNRRRFAVSAVLQYAAKQGYLLDNVAKPIDTLEEDNQITRFLGMNDDREDIRDAKGHRVGERERLMRAAKLSPWNKMLLLVLLASTTGARKSEMMKLSWENIDFQRRTVALLDTKNGEDRTITLSPIVVQEMLKHRQRDGLVFASERRPDRPFEFKKHWYAMLEDAQIQGLRLHDLRHDAASQLVMAGHSLDEVGLLLGHKSTQTTQRYAHLSNDHKHDMTDRLAENFKGML